MSTHHLIPIAPLRLVLQMRRQSDRRCCVYSTHPYTGADCRQPGRWKAHGGPLFSPVCAGFIDRVVDLVKSRGRSEVLRTFGAGIRQLRAEQQRARDAA